MKVVCIDTSKPNNFLFEYSRFLEIGKIYDVVDMVSTEYVIMGPGGGYKFVPKTLFITLEEYREQQLNKIL